MKFHGSRPFLDPRGLTVFDGRFLCFDFFLMNQAATSGMHGIVLDGAKPFSIASTQIHRKMVKREDILFTHDIQEFPLCTNEKQ
jgi:hypothetical protein